MCANCWPDRAQLIVDHRINHPFALKSGTDADCDECGRVLSVHPDKVEFLAAQQTEARAS